MKTPSIRFLPTKGLVRVVPERDGHGEETADRLALVRGGLPEGHLLEDSEHGNGNVFYGQHGENIF